MWDGWQLLAETDGAGHLLRSYVWGPDVSGSVGGAGGVGGLLAVRQHDPNAGGAVSAEYFVVRDAGGNVTGLVDPNTGTVAARYEYGPFGRLVSVDSPSTTMANPAALCPFLFSTKYFDAEVGLYYFGYRYYQPATGRWLNRDPLEEEGGLNLYAFCQNDPVNGVDPLGLEGYPDERDRSEGNAYYAEAARRRAAVAADPSLLMYRDYDEDTIEGIERSGDAVYKNIEERKNAARRTEMKAYRDQTPERIAEAERSYAHCQAFFMGYGMAAGRLVVGAGALVRDIGVSAADSLRHGYCAVAWGVTGDPRQMDIEPWHRWADPDYEPEYYKQGKAAYDKTKSETKSSTLACMDGIRATAGHLPGTSSIMNAAYMLDDAASGNWTLETSGRAGQCLFEAQLLAVAEGMPVLDDAALPVGNRAPKNGVWGRTPIQRGNAIESQLAKSDYGDWFHVGRTQNGKFPLVDFQKGNNLASLKTVDTTGSTWMGRIETHIRDLGTRGATVNGSPANMILDLRVQPGGAGAAQPLIQMGRQHGVTVIIKEFP